MRLHRDKTPKQAEDGMLYGESQIRAIYETQNLLEELDAKINLYFYSFDSVPVCKYCLRVRES